jgi:hypothetical protein
MSEDQLDQEEPKEENPLELSEHVMRSCCDYAEAYLVIGYTKKDRGKFLLAVHKTEDQDRELKKLADAVCAWHGLNGAEVAVPDPEEVGDETQVTRLK